MKRNKIFTLILIVVSMAMGFSSCIGNDDDYNNNQKPTIDPLTYSDKPQIRNLIGCSGTMPEKLQGSFSSTRSLYKRNVRRHKTPLPHKAA